MHYRRLGRTELMVSEIGFGTLAIGGFRWGDVTDEDSLVALRSSYELGVNFYDTADIYGHGHSERLLARAFGEMRDRVIIATKGGFDFTRGALTRPNFAPEYIQSAVEASLSRLETDSIDLYLLHNPPQKLAKEPGIWETLADLRREGKIRCYGVSAHTANDARAFLRAAEVSEDPRRFGDVVQVAYNLIDQEAAAKDVFVEAHRQDWGVISRVPLASGMLTGKYSAEHYFPQDDWRAGWSRSRVAETARKVEVVRFLEDESRTLAQASLAFCLSQPAISTVIVGAKTAEQAEANASASAIAPLPEDEQRSASDLYARGFS